ncbi:MAG: phosphodiester glycosidase family protein [Armatimonadota bacterium]|nr:phosphodiester glycosidase family protein [Armatimonadota bacterium]MDR7428333.1 phosphodiester glycosidase family protein [Armatimonadota bacterium]MDR7463213.1 phosphodiester glycosidase family protein [Armatimonadota bacterium]MDR7469407.1 phosphodiester glycosidase family protein [Armatimonadota bacterium]MDR7474757.1 phosphodiester glycosidase family protein [Armatimonadota bacterium]
MGDKSTRTCRRIRDRSSIVPRFLIALILLLLPPRPAAAQPDARLLDLGWTTQDGAVKIVAHLDRPIRFRATTAGSRLLVDLWPIADLVPRELTVNTGGVGVVRQVAVARGIARLSIGLRGATRYKLFTRNAPYKLAVIVLPPWRAAVPLPPSVAYRAMRVPTARGWSAVHVVQVDLADPQIALRPVLGSGVIPGNEPTAAASTRYDALAAINGGFFSVRTGHPLGLLVIDGKLLSAPTGRRSVFALTSEGRPVIQPFTFRGTVETGTGRTIPVLAVNRPPRQGGLAVYTPEYGPLTEWHRYAVVVQDGVVVGFATGRVPIPQDGYVLSAAEGQGPLLTRTLTANQPVRLNLVIQPGKVVHALGGGPRLVRDGQVHVPFRWEAFSAAFARRRTSRSAVGITAAGKVLLVTVEKSARSRGMTLVELAGLLRDLGAVQAMNLDGGGSSTLVVGGRVVNRPERTQRSVGSMLLVVRRPAD